MRLFSKADFEWTLPSGVGVVVVDQRSSSMLFAVPRREEGLQYYRPSR